MNNSGDAAEQVVRLSLEGVEVAAKITGEAAKNIGIMLLSAVKEEQKTKGKSRLSKMIRSGKELKVFSIEQKDLKNLRRKQNAMVFYTMFCVIGQEKMMNTQLLILLPVLKMLQKFSVYLNALS